MTATVRAAALLWSASILLSRVIGMIREGVIGRTLGAGQDADLYQAAFVLPDFLNYLLAGGALSVVLIPILVHHRQAKNPQALKESFGAILSAVAAAIVLLTALTYLALPYFLPFWFPGFSPDTQDRLLTLTSVILPAQIFHVTGGVCSAALLAHDRHAIPALAPLLYTGCIVLGGLIGASSAGAMGFAWGVLVGSVLGPFLMPLIGVYKLGLLPRWWLPRWHPDLWRYLKGSLPIMLGFSIVMMDEWIFKRLASPMAPGAVAQLGYARALMRVPMGVFGLAMGAASFPLMSAQAAEKDWPALAGTASSAVRKVLVLALGAQVLLTLVGQDIAHVIYGERMNEVQREAIAINLIWMSLALGAWSTHNLFARVFYAQGRTWVPSVCGTLCMLGFYPLYVYLGDQMGAQGLAIAGSAAMTVYVLTLAIWARKTLGQSLHLGIFVPRVLGAAALSIAGFFWLDLGPKLEPVLDWLAGFPVLAALLRGAVVGICALVVYTVLLFAFGVPEISAILGMLRRRVMRRKG